jgi:hypothetical protein
MFDNRPTTNEPDRDRPWKQRLDEFSRSHQDELAALSWGLWLENGKQMGAIGIDIKPTPHFVYCSEAALQRLNESVDDRLQELLGIVANYQAEKEVAIVAIGLDQVKLVHFAPKTPPPACHEKLGRSPTELMDSLEAAMAEILLPTEENN